jgi:hypothetical protein
MEAAIPQNLARPMEPFWVWSKSNACPISCKMSPWMLNVKADVTSAIQLKMNSRRVLIIPLSLDIDGFLALSSP